MKSGRQLKWRSCHAKKELCCEALRSVYPHCACRIREFEFGKSCCFHRRVLLFSLIWADYSPHGLDDSPIITYNAPVYKYTSVYLHGKMYTEKKIEMFVCHCNLGVGTFRVWFLATIWDHKQRANLNNVWLSGQVQSHKYQAFMRVFLQAKPGEFSGECYVILVIVQEFEDCNSCVCHTHAKDCPRKSDNVAR